MADKKKVLFGTGYEYDPTKTQEENWEALKAHYAKQGIKYGNMPKDDEDIVKVFEELKPQLEKELKEKKRK